MKGIARKHMKIENWNRHQETVLRINERGSVVEDRVIKKSETITFKKNFKELTPQQKALLKNKTELTKYSEELGGYIHMSYIKNELLFNQLDIDRANISRLIYLSTFIDYNNRQENLLIKYGQHKVIENMTRADIKKVLGLGDRAFINFINDMKKNHLLFEVDNKFYINNDYFNKGNNNFNSKEYTRIFIDTTRLLFEGCTSRQHKQLSYVFQLIPFMNFELNILCSNPNEPDFYELDKLGLVRICEMLGVSTEKKSMNKFENDLLKFTIRNNEKTYYLFKRVIVKGGNGKFDYFVINPYVVWGGGDVDRVKKTIQSCFFKK